MLTLVNSVAHIIKRQTICDSQYIRQFFKFTLLYISSVNHEKLIHYFIVSVNHENNQTKDYENIFEIRLLVLPIRKLLELSAATRDFV